MSPTSNPPKQPQAQQARGPGFIGIVTEVESYTEARATVYVSETALLRYGALALIEEPGGKRFLALVTDVSERSMMPSLDSRKLAEAFKLVQAAGLQDAKRLLEMLFSPSQSLIRWHGIRELKLRILGEVTGSGTLSSITRPPRPSAAVKEPDNGLLQGLLTRGLDRARLIYMGRLAYNPEVSAYLDPEKLNMHIAILGQTGSGKTETVKRLAAEYAWLKDKFSSGGGVIVVDVAGEYTGHPYIGADAYPLLDAAIAPHEFTSHEADWLRSAKKTILVPYDISTISFRRAAEEQYVKEYTPLLEKLDKRYSSCGYQAKAIVYGRHGIHLVEKNTETGRWETRLLGYNEALKVLREEPLLVIGIPLPSTLPAEEAAELGKVTTENFPAYLEQTADTLGLFESGLIHEAKGLAHLMLAMLENPQGTSWRRLTEAVKEAAVKYQNSLQEGELKAEKDACSTLINETKNIWGGFIDCRSIAGLYAYILKTIIEEAKHKGIENLPDIRGEAPWSIIAKTAQHESGATIFNELVKRLERAAGMLGQLHHSTRASLRRGLRNMERHVSPYLDDTHYLEAVKRALEGFTIVLLAPPSRGTVEREVARLLDTVFNYSVEAYNPERKTLIVVEEAHNLAPAGGRGYTNAVMKKLAREGRKWGISLAIVTQRPGFIDPDVLSQAATLAALRITNPDDISALKRSVESASQEFIQRLPDLEPGQAVLAGIAVPERKTPILVKIEKIAPKTKTRPEDTHYCTPSGSNQQPREDAKQEPPNTSTKH